jgi:uncharacterized protein (DUF58 family)
MPAAGRLRERLFARRQPASDEDLFDPRVFSRLDRMRLRVGSAYGSRSGETRVRGHAQSSGIEVESFKSYTPGDDIRYIDWNAVGRLDQLLTRRFVAEREIPVHLLLDASRSMAFPAEDGKFRFAVRLAGALAYIALNNNDSVRVATLHAEGEGVSVEESPLLRHRGRYLRLKPFLGSARAAGETGLGGGVLRYLERHRERGKVFLISDFLVPSEAYRHALERLRERRLEAHAIHVVGRQERSLGGLRGRLLLRDAENGSVRAVALSEADRRRYAQEFERRVSEIRDFCHRSDVGYALVSAEAGIESCLTSVLPAAGMLHLR